MSFSKQCLIISKFFFDSFYSFYLFAEFAEKSDAYKLLICRVELVHFHVRVSVKNLKKKFLRHILCWDPTRVFANARRLLTSCVFPQQSEILYWENKLDKEFRELKQQNQNSGWSKLLVKKALPQLCLWSLLSSHISSKPFDMFSNFNQSYLTHLKLELFEFDVAYNSSCRTLSQTFASNWFRWRISDERPGVA